MNPKYIGNGAYCYANCVAMLMDSVEESGKILIGEKGITWTAQDSPRLKQLLGRGVRVA